MKLGRGAARLVATGGLSVALVTCAPAEPEGNVGREESAEAATPPTAPPAPAERSTSSSGCIRGGTTRGEVRAIMGEPDSVVFGAWMYGTSSITFGYGVVLDFSNDGENLVLC